MQGKEKIYHSALIACAELLDNMRDGDPITEVPMFLAAKLKQLEASRCRAQGGNTSDESSELATPVSQAPVAQAVPEGFVLMPKRLTAENGAKSLFMGEFKEQIMVECPMCGSDDEECEVCGGEGRVSQDVTVGWDTIKNIYALAVEHLAAPTITAASAQLKHTDLSHRLRETADQQPGWKSLLNAAADEIDRYYSGMLAWKQTAEKKDRDWNAERMARVNERCEARASAQTAPGEVRDQALEEAAKLCESEICACCWKDGAEDAALYLAEEIRNLKGQTGAATQDTSGGKP